jgi:hypothetical protein
MYQPRKLSGLDFTNVVCGAVILIAAAGGAGFLDRLFDRFAGFTGALLNAANQFFLLAFGKLEIVIRELGPLLFQLALGDVPVAFDFECGHNSLVCDLLLFVLIRRQRDGKSVFAALGLALPVSPPSA